MTELWKFWLKKGIRSFKMTDIQKRLFELQDKRYAEFSAKLTPTVDADLFIGVRIPQMRKLAKTLVKEGNYEDFLNEIPHKYYDENVLHGLILSELKDYENCIEKVEQFLPCVDNWAVCDTMSPGVFKRHKDELMEKIVDWTISDHTYTCRFGMLMLMKHFLDDDFKEEYLEIPAGVISEEYYVNMMIAWFFATALAKQWEAAVPYIENRRLSEWTHRKTIQKSCESYRITEEQKVYLRGLK